MATSGSDRLLGPPTQGLYLLGPNLLLELAAVGPTAEIWAQTVSPSECVVSMLAVEMARSTIDTSGYTAARQRDWNRTLDQMLARLRLGGAIDVGLDQAVLQEWRHWRCMPGLNVEVDGASVEIDQDLRQLLATARCCGYVFTELQAPYLSCAAGEGVSVWALEDPA